jgi:hypothetical protein
MAFDDYNKGAQGTRISTPEQEPREIPRQLQLLHEKVAEVCGLAERFVERCAPVLRPGSPPPEAVTNAKDSVTALGGQLDELSHRLRRVSYFLSNALEALELPH